MSPLSILGSLSFVSLALWVAIGWSYAQPAQSFKLAETYESRSIASVTATEKSTASAFQSMRDLQIPCEDYQTHMDGQYLRLELIACKDLGTLEQIENRSTGIRADWFKLSQQLYSTDYIRLRPGANRIEIQRRKGKDKLHVQEIVVERL